MHYHAPWRIKARKAFRSLRQKIYRPICWLIGHSLWESHYWSGGHEYCRRCDHHRLLWLPQRAFDCQAIQLFDRDGYYSCVIGKSAQEAKDKMREKNIKGLIFCTLPYGCYMTDNVPDVSLPADWKEELKSMDKGRED